MFVSVLGIGQSVYPRITSGLAGNVSVPRNNLYPAFGFDSYLDFAVPLSKTTNRNRVYFLGGGFAVNLTRLSKTKSFIEFPDDPVHIISISVPIIIEIKLYGGRVYDGLYPRGAREMMSFEIGLRPALQTQLGGFNSLENSINFPIRSFGLSALFGAKIVVNHRKSKGILIRYEQGFTSLFGTSKMKLGKFSLGLYKDFGKKINLKKQAKANARKNDRLKF